jgi:hypothetical protein
MVACVCRRADVEMYRRVLLMGCRCVEIDAWDDKRGSRVGSFFTTSSNEPPPPPLAAAASDGVPARPRNSVFASGAVPGALAGVPEPVVTHHYRTKPLLSFREVVRTIKHCAFPPRYEEADGGKKYVRVGDERFCGVSEYPVVISLENNCARQRLGARPRRAALHAPACAHSATRTHAHALGGSWVRVQVRSKCSASWRVSCERSWVTS